MILEEFALQIRLLLLLKKRIFYLHNNNILMITIPRATRGKKCHVYKNEYLDQV